MQEATGTREVRWRENTRRPGDADEKDEARELSPFRRQGDANTHSAKADLAGRTSPLLCSRMGLPCGTADRVVRRTVAERKGAGGEERIHPRGLNLGPL